MSEQVASVCPNCGSEFTAAFTGHECPDCGSQLSVIASPQLPPQEPPPPERFTDPNGLQWQNAGHGWTYWNGQEWVISPTPPPGYGAKEPKRHVGRWVALVIILCWFSGERERASTSPRDPTTPSPHRTAKVVLRRSTHLRLRSRHSFNPTDRGIPRKGHPQVVCNPPASWKAGPPSVASSTTRQPPSGHTRARCSPIKGQQDSGGTEATSRAPSVPERRCSDTPTKSVPRDHTMHREPVTKFTPPPAKLHGWPED